LFFISSRKVYIMRTDYTKAGSKAAEVVNDTKKTENTEVKTQGTNKTRQKMFVSIPMAGRDEKDVLAEIESIRDKFKENYDVIDSYFQEDDPNGIDKYSSVWYLGRSIQLMRTANLVIFTKNWSQARGCIIEHRVCELYDIPYIEMI